MEVIAAAESLNQPNSTPPLDSSGPENRSFNELSSSWTVLTLVAFPARERSAAPRRARRSNDRLLAIEPSRDWSPVFVPISTELYPTPVDLDHEILERRDGSSWILPSMVTPADF